MEIDALNWNAAGALINSALFFLFVFAAAILGGNLFAVAVLIAAVGVTFLTYAMQGWRAPWGFVVAAHFLSFALGVLAFLFLLAGYSLRGWV